MRVIIADDQIEVRSALCLLLEHEPGITVVGEAANAARLLAQVHRLHPDIVLLDWELPGLPVAELIPFLRDLVPHLAVVALSGQPEARSAAAGVGVEGFVSKSEPPERVLSQLRNVSHD